MTSKPFSHISGNDSTETLTSVWKIYSKVATHLENGRRLENLSWRLWFLQEAIVSENSQTQKHAFKEFSKNISRKLAKDKKHSISELQAPRFNRATLNGTIRGKVTEMIKRRDVKVVQAEVFVNIRPKIEMNMLKSTSTGLVDMTQSSQNYKVGLTYNQHRQKNDSLRKEQLDNAEVVDNNPLHDHLLARGVNGLQDSFGTTGFTFLSPDKHALHTPIWAMGESQTVGIPLNRSYGRTSNMSNSSFSSYPHNWEDSSFFTTSNTLTSPLSTISSFNPSIGQSALQFRPEQQVAAQKIYDYMQVHPKSAIPASLFSPDLIEVRDGRGWCLIGQCGFERITKKLSSNYDITKDMNRRRLDHLYDHVRDKHFDNRPFRCNHSTCKQSFAREHDLKRHELAHNSQPIPCQFCDKVYTRNDNLKRHIQLKHSSVLMPTTLPLPLTADRRVTDKLYAEKRTGASSHAGHQRYRSSNRESGVRAATPSPTSTASSSSRLAEIIEATSSFRSRRETSQPHSEDGRGIITGDVDGGSSSGSGELSYAESRSNTSSRAGYRSCESSNHGSDARVTSPGSANASSSPSRLAQIFASIEASANSRSRRKTFRHQSMSSQ